MSGMGFMSSEIVSLLLEQGEEEFESDKLWKRRSQVASIFGCTDNAKLFFSNYNIFNFFSLSIYFSTIFALEEKS